MTIYPNVQSPTTPELTCEVTESAPIDVGMIEKVNFHDYIKKHIHLFNGIPYITLFKNLDGEIVCGNKQYSEFMQNTLAESTLLTDNSGEEHILQNGTTLSYEYNLETQSGTKWFEVYKAPMFDEKQNITGLIITAKDITKQKILDEEKEIFVATLVHDLKSPTLAQIQTLNLLLKSSYGTLTPKQVSVLQEIKNSCDYSYSIIDTLLRGYKYANKSTELNYSEFQLADVAKKVQNILQIFAKERNIKIRVIQNNLDSNVFADKLEIKRVIMNLLSNAISYAEINSTIEIFITKNKNKIRLEVINQGEYIPQENINRLFEKYFSRAKKFSKISTGLGLYLTKQIIHAHNGMIIAKSSKNGKIAFGFELNCAEHLKKLK